ncbi:MAG TPA: hypothetical protein VGZ02_05825 [Candidatus Baltobacteraceae bacterium]|jgi:phosphoribosylamine-glycine ligase|nr:hypothetical protein [Candidatus Baltobacteraceae bacterium]
MQETSKQELGDGGWAWKPDRDLGSSYSYVGDTEKVVSFCKRTVIPKVGDNVKCIVQERIPGVALSTARWWNGTQWTGPYEATLEEKKFMDGDVGPATGCALNTLWFYDEDEPKIAKALKWESLAESFRGKEAPPGLYDINAIVNKQGAYFLEWTPRLGIDSELTSQRAFTNLSDVLEAIATGGSIDDFVNIDTGYHGVRLSVPPYPCEDKGLADLKIAVGTAVEGLTSLWHGNFVMVGLKHTPKGLEVADPYGFVGMAIATDRSVEKGFAKIAKTIKTIDIAHLQYRTDGAKIVTADIEQMHKYGWPTSPYLTIAEKEAA